MRRSTRAIAGRRWLLPLCLLSAITSTGCADKSYVTNVGATEARLGVAVSLAALAVNGEITAVRIIARYDNTALSRSIVLRDVTVPYRQGESRNVALTLDIAECLRDVRLRDNSASACPVRIAVEVLSDARVLVRDELPVVNVRPGESTTTPALSARGATDVRVLYNAVAAPASIPLVTGGTAQLTGDALDAAGAVIAGRVITWTSASSAVASISATGLVTALAPGSAEVSASIGTGNAIVRRSTTIAVAAPVAAAVQLAPATATVNVGAAQPLTATVRDAAGATIAPTPTLTWQSAQPSVAAVSSAGVVTGVGAGSASITARTDNGVIGTATVTVVAVPATITLAPPAPSLVAGSTQQLTPTVRDATGTTITPAPILTWATSAIAVATVSTSGLVTAVAPGTAAITARSANGTTGTANVTVTASILTVTLAPSAILVGPNFSQPVTATVRDGAGNVVIPTPALTWQSANSTIASVSQAGVVTGFSIGSTTVTARTVSGSVGTATVTVAPAGSFSGRVFDFDNNANIAGATVTVTVNSVLRTFTTDARGIYNTGMIFGAIYDLRVSAPGFVSTDVRALAVNGDRTVEATPLARTAVTGGTIIGDLRNATTNLIILTPVTLDLYAGQNTTTGVPVASTTSNANGGYAFTNVATGTYTIVGRATGFNASSRTTASLGISRVSSQQTLFLSPTTAVGSLRIVLTWGALPTDLDAHLTGPGPNASTFWVYWNSLGSCTSQPFACLDVDQTNGRGPETLTIAQANGGRYVYSVDNFSKDAALSQSNARVDVYGPNGLLRSFGVPAQPGTLWRVFEWDGTTITGINTVSTAPPPATLVGGDRLPAASFLAMPAKPAPVRKP